MLFHQEKPCNIYDKTIRDAISLEPKRILLSGGLGDFLVAESFITNDERAEISTVVNACCYAKEISSLLRLLPNYSIKNEVFLWDNLPTSKCRCVTVGLRKGYPGITNLNFWCVVAAAKQKKRRYNNSSFLLHDLGCDLSKFRLPREYVCIVPYTESESRLHPRNYTLSDWESTTSFLFRSQLPGVILGTKKGKYQSTCLVDLSGKTSIVEAIEILKGAKGFIGIDSFLSILATKLFKDILLVKTVAGHVFAMRDIYFATSLPVSPSFLQKKIQTSSLS